MSGRGPAGDCSLSGRLGSCRGHVAGAEVLAAEAAHVLDQRRERLTLGRQRVLHARGHLGVGVALDDALQNRALPSARSRITRIVHLPQMMSAVAQTGQLESLTSSESSAMLQELK